MVLILLLLITLRDEPSLVVLKENSANMFTADLGPTLAPRSSKLLLFLCEIPAHFLSVCVYVSVRFQSDGVPGKLRESQERRDTEIEREREEEGEGEREREREREGGKVGEMLLSRVSLF